jgi:hypothetical protein
VVGPDGRSVALSERVMARRQARQRARLRQAMAGERGSARVGSGPSAWLVGSLAALAFGVTLGWAVSALTHRFPDVRAGLAATIASWPGPEIAVRAVDPPPATPGPTAEPEILAGPVVGVRMLEANGPIAGCSFHHRLGELRARIGTSLVGECVEAAHPQAGDEMHQRTTRGELIWHEEDGRAAFTDGEHSWITGPNGIVRRRNEERFAWERDADDKPRPPTTTHVLPPPLPGSILPSRRIVSYYGNPLARGMGVLGELPPEQLFPRLRAQADAYRSADRSRPVAPALELVAVVAQGEPGPDGLFRLRMETALIDRVVAWAEEHDFLVILDLQVGRGSVDEEVRWLLPYLKRPNIHLALDPEFAMPASHVPGQRVGTMDASTINRTLRVLADLVESEELPPKLLLAHRFTEEMVTGARQIVTDPRVQVVMVMDGFGTPALKTRQYDALIAQQRVQYTGFKLFYRHDTPLMTPEQVILLEPAPDLVIYQ